MNWLTQLEDLLATVQIDGAKRSRIDLLIDEGKTQLGRIGNLERENSNLRNENQRFKTAEHEKLTFVEARGAFFKRNAAGKFEDVYCPNCKIPMTSLEGELPYKCSKCKRQVNFTGHELPGIIAQLQ